MDMSRRAAINLSLAAGTLLAAGSAAGASPPESSATFLPAAPEPRALPFDPKAVPGFSEAILTSHHANNYTGAVRRIPAIGAEIAALDPATAPGFQLKGLKREELMAINSMILHEVYFTSFGPEARAPDAALAAQIEKDFGSQTAWRAEFSAMGKALGGGSGWVLLVWSKRLGRLINQWAADHSMTLGDGAPLLTLDMYEHAYHMDYGAKAGAYVDAFMKILDWRTANDVFARAVAQ